jgi:hypothetical protein
MTAELQIVRLTRFKCRDVALIEAAWYSTLAQTKAAMQSSTAAGHDDLS